MTNYIMLILLVVRLIIAVQLTRVSISKKLPNLMWLAAFFFVTCVGDFFFIVVPIIWVFALGVGLGEIAMVFFIQQTFYRGRKSPFVLFLLIAILFAVGDVYFTATTPYFYPYFSPFNWIWLIVAGNRAYKQIANDKTVEGWVKGRYKLVIAYSIICLAAPIQSAIVFISSIVSPTTSIYTNPLFSAYLWFVLAATTTGVVLSYLAWIMPQGYVRFLNRNDQMPSPVDLDDNQMSEEEIMKQFQSN